MIKFDWRLFNPLYWHILDAMQNNDIRFVLIYGGSSAAKTYSIAQAFSIDTLAHHNNQLCMRKFSVDLQDTIYTDFKNITGNLNKLTNNIKPTTNRIDIGDAKLRFRGLDKSHRVQGISSYQRVYLDEITHFFLDDFKQLKKRLRGRVGQQIFGSWNPISINHWINKSVIANEEWEDLPLELPNNPYSKLYSGELYEENSFKRINKEGNMLLIKTTYRDNWWIVGHPAGEQYGYYDKHVIADYASDKIHNPIDYDIYANGNWGILTDRLAFKPSEWEVIDEIPEGAKQIPSGLDFGFEGDPTALTDYYVKGNYLIWDERIYKRGLTNIKQMDSLNRPICASIQGELEEMNYSKEQLIIAESAEPKSVRELRNADYNIFAVKKGGIVEGIKLLKKYKHLITKRSTNIIYEFENYTKKIDKDDNILDEYIDKDNHCMDNARYVQFMKDRLW